MTLDPGAVARLLSGSCMGRNVLAPGPGHSRADRSLSIKIDPAAPDGFIVHSFAGDSAIVCRDYVRAVLGVAKPEPRDPKCFQRPRRGGIAADHDDHSAIALRLWHDSLDPYGTIVTAYLASRGLRFPDDFAADAIRFHPAIALDGSYVPGMVALFRDIKTNEPCGIHRTFLDSSERKLRRKMLGRARGAAIKLDHDEDVTLGLHVGEGVETCLAAQCAGFRPVWALGSAGAIASFPVIPGIGAITILGETDDGGANYRAAQRCAERWIEAGQEAFLVAPQVGTDLNDVWAQVRRD